MIEERKSSMVYLSKADLQSIHASLSAKAKEDGDPIPPFSLADQGDIDSLVNIPQRSFFGREQYPTLESKAAIIYYTINHKQIFRNGNKRMSTFCLLTFLAMNGKLLDVLDDDLTKKALWLANTSAGDFQDIKEELEVWIKEHIIDFEFKSYAIAN